MMSAKFWRFLSATDARHRRRKVSIAEVRAIFDELVDGTREHSALQVRNALYFICRFHNEIGDDDVRMLFERVARASRDVGERTEAAVLLMTWVRTSPEQATRLEETRAIVRDALRAGVDRHAEAALRDFAEVR